MTRVGEAAAILIHPLGITTGTRLVLLCLLAILTKFSDADGLRMIVVYKQTEIDLVISS